MATRDSKNPASQCGEAWRVFVDAVLQPHLFHPNVPDEKWERVLSAAVAFDGICSPLYMAKMFAPDSPSNKWPVKDAEYWTESAMLDVKRRVRPEADRLAADHFGRLLSISNDYAPFF